MASSDGNKMEDIRRMVECSICIEKLTIPRMLPCLHTYCEACLSAHMMEQGQRGSFKCPLCNTAFVVPQEGAAGFPHNFHLSQLCELVHDVTGEETADHSAHGVVKTDAALAKKGPIKHANNFNHGLTNSAGALAKKGDTGRYYCGRRVLNCRCCNGHCGPTNGCNCRPCHELDKRNQGPSSGRLFNSDGALAAKGVTGRYYCGRRVLDCRCCNGHCGPTNGCNCRPCHELDELNQGPSSGRLFNAAGVLARKGVTGRYYCGARVLSCRCCNGHCGPTNGCNCRDCHILDKMDQEPLGDGILNAAGAIAKKGVTGRYYCGRRVLDCRCCNGYCGPTNGCNCRGCHELDNLLG